MKLVRVHAQPGTALPASPRRIEIVIDAVLEPHETSEAVASKVETILLLSCAEHADLTDLDVE